MDYATVDEYRLYSGDEKTNSERVAMVLADQSSKLRAKAGIKSITKLTDDQMSLARSLVCDAASKMLVRPVIDGLEDVSGVKQSSFSADGFQGSYTFANPSGTAYFDNDTFKAFMRSLGRSQRIGNIMPSYGVKRC